MVPGRDSGLMVETNMKHGKQNVVVTWRQLDNVTPETSPATSKNKELYAELIQLLDDRSIALILQDAVDKGKEALEI